MTPSTFYTNAAAAGVAVTQFFTGATPLSAGDIIRLSTASDVQLVAYTKAGVGQPHLGPFEAFGKDFAAANPSVVSIATPSASFFASAYTKVFGTAGTPGQISHFVDQENSFKALYLANGFTAENAAIQARGAAVGQLIGEAVKDLDTVYGSGTAKFLADTADGSTIYGQPLGNYHGDTVTVIKEVPGPTVTVPGPTVDAPDATTVVFGSLDAKYVNPANTLLFGDNTTPNNGMDIVKDPISGALVSIADGPRQANNGEKYMPTSSSFDGVTLTVAYTNPAGPQDMSNGSFANNANRGAASTMNTFGHETDLKAFLTAGNTLHQAYDMDATAAVNRVEFVSFIAGDGTIDFAQVGGPGAITDSGGNQFAVANSQQQQFFTGAGVAGLTVGAQFSNDFWIENSAGVRLVGIVENITLGQPGFSPADQLS